MTEPLTTHIAGTSALLPATLLELEFAKDRWDARNIPGLWYAPHRNEHYILFTDLPDVFRPLVKDYVKFQIAASLTAGTIILSTQKLRQFFAFFSPRYPDACSLHDLTERDIDAFVFQLKADAHTRKSKNVNRYVWYPVHCLAGFLFYLEQIQSPMKPNGAPFRIILPHHYPALGPHWIRT